MKYMYKNFLKMMRRLNSLMIQELMFWQILLAPKDKEEIHFTFQDALFPIVEHGRITVGKLAILNPEEINQKVNFYTTSGFRGSDEFDRSLRMKDDMINLNGKMVMGSDWHLGCWYGRGSTKSQIMDKKKNMSPIAFAQNYEEKWVGSVDGCLVDINKLMTLRSLSNPDFESEDKFEYICSMDVARSMNKSNNQSSIVVLKLKKNKKGRIICVQLVNIINLPNGLNFTAQSIELKKIAKLYNSKMNIIDENGLGKGILDELLKEQIDPTNGEMLSCWNTINTDHEPDSNDAEQVLYALHSQGINTEIIFNFIDMVESKKLQLLEKRQLNEFDSDSTKKFLPYLETDFLIEEVANLKLKPLQSGKYTTEQVTKRIDRDRFSALAYGLWYIKNYEDKPEDNTEVDPMDYFFCN